jgi:hypothetical protein
MLVPMLLLSALVLGVITCGGACSRRRGGTA